MLCNGFVHRFEIIPTANCDALHSQAGHQNRDDAQWCFLATEHADNSNKTADTHCRQSLGEGVCATNFNNMVDAGFAG